MEVRCITWQLLLLTLMTLIHLGSGQRRLLPFIGRSLHKEGVACSTSKGRGLCIYQTYCHLRGGKSLAPCLNGIMIGTCCQFQPNAYIENTNLLTNVMNLPSSQILSPTVHPLPLSDSSTSSHNSEKENIDNIKSTSFATIPSMPNSDTVVRKPVSIINVNTASSELSYPSDTTTKNTHIVKDSIAPHSWFSSKTTTVIPNSSSAESIAPDLDEHLKLTAIKTPLPPSGVSFSSTSFPLVHILPGSFPAVWPASPSLSVTDVDDFPLHAIQQIIDDFANESSAQGSSEHVSTVTATNEWTNSADIISNFNHTKSDFTTKKTNAVTDTSMLWTFKETSTLRATTNIPSNDQLPSDNFPILGISNSTSSSVVVAESVVEHIPEVSYGPINTIATEKTTERSPTEVFPPSTTTTAVRASTLSISKETITQNPSLQRTTIKPVVTSPTRLPPKRTRKPTRIPVKKHPSTLPHTTTTIKISTDYTKECGIRPLAPSGRIVGGKKAVFGQWPWQALVKESTWFGLVVKTKCGGVLINNKYVITAAHCQPGWLASLLVLLGDYNLNSESEQLNAVQRNVRRVVTHRNFNSGTFENDIALLEMDRAVVFQPHIIPICLPIKGEDFTGKSAVVSGWGRLSTGGTLPSILHFVDVPIMRNDVCQDMFKSAGQQKFIQDTFVCAGYKNGGKDSCEGDSGGPLMLPRDDGRWVLVGTVSHGVKCAYPNLPGVYTRITSYLDWIHKNAKL